jgi:hypothetical protein
MGSEPPIRLVITEENIAREASLDLQTLISFTNKKTNTFIHSPMSLQPG